MLKFCIILIILQNAAYSSCSFNIVENFMDKLQNNQLRVAENMLKNITTIENLYEISLKILKLENGLIKLMFFNIINENHYNWPQSLDINKLLDIWRALKLDFQLLEFKNMTKFLKELELNLIEKCALKIKFCLILNHFKEFEYITKELNILNKELLQQIVNLSLNKTYGLILAEKILKRLNLTKDLNKIKILYFIEFYKHFKNQEGLNLALIYKISLNLRYILFNYDFNDNDLYFNLINLKQSLPSDISLLVFSKQICIKPQSLESQYLTAKEDNDAFVLNATASENIIWLSYIFENKLILESKLNNLEIFINYSYNLNDNFNEYHLKPVTANSYILLNTKTQNILCLRNFQTFWQNTMELDISNCLWSLNNCTSLKRFLINEYN